MMPARRQHEWIKMELRLRGSSLADVARELGVTRSTVTAVCLGHRRSQRIESMIGMKLGMPVERLWPNRHAGRSKHVCSVSEPPIHSTEVRPSV